MKKLIVQDTEISLSYINDQEYICITDMLKAKDGDFFVTDWLRNRNTMEFLGVWERVYNPDFNYGEFATIRNQAGLNSFKISVKEFVARTNAISLYAKAGRYGGTYAHKDIAFEFAMWISPEFKVYVVREFQRLKEEEQRLVGWTAKRELSKINYRIHTDASINELICLSNMENLNAVFINDGIPQHERLVRLNKIAIQQMKVLEDVGGRNLLKN